MQDASPRRSGVEITVSSLKLFVVKVLPSVPGKGWEKKKILWENKEVAP